MKVVVEPLTYAVLAPYSSTNVSHPSFRRVDNVHAMKIGGTESVTGAWKSDLW
ncbi:hypothetical protein ACVMB1_006142 [Bradyrhizobium sp. USDA 4504]